MQQEKLKRLAEWSVGLEIAGTAISDAQEAWDVHVQDSLAGLELEPLKSASSIIDIGSGAGFPGLVLAAARPQARVVLVDSVRKKMEAAAAVARELELDNVECVWGRAEEIADRSGPHFGAYDVVTARALAQLGVLLEYASPLLVAGGHLVAWKGQPTEDELVTAAAAATEVGMAAGQLIETRPFARSRTRHFYLARKVAETPWRYPRRAGMALKRPIG